jgi:hypothetical protein
MTVVTFLLLLVIAAIAAGAWVVLAIWPAETRGRGFAAAFVAFALLLVLPALLPKLLGG